MEARHLLAADGWYNVDLPADVNDDGLVTPVDALLVANVVYANEGGSVMLTADNPASVYPDVNNDGQIGMADMTAVTNEFGGGSGGDAGSGNALQTNATTSPTTSSGSGTATMMTSMSSSSGGGVGGGGAGGSSTSIAYYTVAVDSPTVSEDGGNLEFTITLHGDVPGGATIHYTTGSGGGAAATPSSGFHVNNPYASPLDYVWKQDQVVLSNDGDTATVQVQVLDDVWVEQDETVDLTIDSVTNNPMAVNGVSHQYDAVHSTTVGTGTIDDNDAALVKLLPFQHLNSQEGSSGSGLPQFNRTFRAQLNNPVDAEVTVNMTVTPGTANGSDYSIPPNQVIKFGVGSSFSNHFHVDIVGDRIIELDEDYTVSIAGVSVGGGRDVQLDPNPANVSIKDTIGNDDRGTINLVAAWSLTRTETAPDALEDQWTVTSPLSGLPQTIQFEVRLKHDDGDYANVAIDVPVTVNWQTVNGSAIIGGTGPGSTDYTGGSGAIISSTRLFGVLPVAVVADAVAEPDQWFKVELVGTLDWGPMVTARPVTLGNTSLTAWIRGDDYATINIGGGVAVTEKGAGMLQDLGFVVSLTGLIDRSVSVSVNDIPGNGAGGPHATPGTGGDYLLMTNSVSFAPLWSTTQTGAAVVRVYGDNISEPDEYFSVLLGVLTDNGLAPFIGIGTNLSVGKIINDD
ncbi:MAG: dockerin type I domain-containing protein [Planctomycetota bacterium]|nr:dockerin type I domain-containing protein [Planctomycetota bacterium]